MQASEIVSFLWGVADLLRDSLKRSRYQDVILPLTVLRRIDCLLAATRQEVLRVRDECRDEQGGCDARLRAASGTSFYNTSHFDFGSLLGDSARLAPNLRSYISGFSPNLRDVIDKFGFDITISRLETAGILFPVMERFRRVDLHLDAVSIRTMGKIFDALIRQLNAGYSETPGEHFTPRDVIHLMVSLVLAGDEERLRDSGMVTIADPCCGTGGTLTATKDRILGSEEHRAINSEAKILLFGQEINAEAFALCKSDLVMKDPDGQGAEGVLFGSTLEEDLHVGRQFDYQLANPPYGLSWKRYKNAVEAEAKLGDEGRFGAGTPRIGDGQLLFLQHMLSHLKPVEDGGSRVAIIMNGSPLFTGGARSGESEIRRWVLENDLLEGLIALPEQLFYNTGILTYLWLLSNRKTKARQGKVQLVDATDLWTPLPKSEGDKRRKISSENVAEILDLFLGFETSERSKILPNTHFGYRIVRVERPLRLAFQASEERIARLESERGFQSLANSRNKERTKKLAEETEGRRRQREIRSLLVSIGDKDFQDREDFRKELKKAAEASGIDISLKVRRAIEAALSERDEAAAACVDDAGQVVPDIKLRDHEMVRLDRSVGTFFREEVLPYVPDAWIVGDGSITEDRTDQSIYYQIDPRIFELERLRQRARELGLQEYRFREIFSDISQVKSESDPVSFLDVLYVPRFATGLVRMSFEHRSSRDPKWLPYFVLTLRPGSPWQNRFFRSGWRRLSAR